MTLVKDEKAPDASKSNQNRRKEKNSSGKGRVAAETLKKSVDIVEEDQYLSGPSSGVR